MFLWVDWKFNFSWTGNIPVITSGWNDHQSSDSCDVANNVSWDSPLISSCSQNPPLSPEWWIMLPDSWHSKSTCMIRCWPCCRLALIWSELWGKRSTRRLWMFREEINEMRLLTNCRLDMSSLTWRKRSQLPRYLDLRSLLSIFLFFRLSWSWKAMRWRKLVNS